MTKKLYFDDQYLREFSSAVIQNIETGQRPGIILEQTLFYPTSGGQPHDIGTINDIPVIDVYEDADHQIIHVLEKTVAGKSVKGRISWERRFDHMQQHTGQHLLSQVFMQLCNAETLSFHLGATSATVDINQAGFTIETITAVEESANRIIYENRPVMSHTIGKDELHQYPVRKPPVVLDNIRIVEIKDFDFSPCGGTHCSHTGEIGILKIRRFENYKGGTRIHFLCGLRALKDYRHISAIVKCIGDSLNTGEADLVKNIKKIQDESKLLQREHSRLRKQYLEYEAKSLFSERHEVKNKNIIAKTFEDRNPKELKTLAKKVLKHFSNTIVLFGSKAEGKASLYFLRSEELDYDMGKLMQDACAVINGRGGGRPQQAQGGGAAVDKLDAALQSAYELISKG